MCSSDLPLDAITKGTLAGINLLTAIVAMLIVAIALVTLVNMGIGHLPLGDGEAMSLQRLFAYAFRPIVWAMGIPWPETGVAASLMATKTVLNEFVAFLDLGRLDPGALAPKSRLIMTYALCGFANFGSVGILVGGLGAMVPADRRHEVEIGRAHV